MGAFLSECLNGEGSRESQSDVRQSAREGGTTITDSPVNQSVNASFGPFRPEETFQGLKIAPYTVIGGEGEIMSPAKRPYEVELKSDGTFTYYMCTEIYHGCYDEDPVEGIRVAGTYEFTSDQNVTLNVASCEYSGFKLGGQIISFVGVRTRTGVSQVRTQQAQQNDAGSWVISPSRVDWTCQGDSGEAGR